MNQMSVWRGIGIYDQFKIWDRCVLGGRNRVIQDKITRALDKIIRKLSNECQGWQELRRSGTAINYVLTHRLQ